jgi:hypothetical protein
MSPPHPNLIMPSEFPKNTLKITLFLQKHARDPAVKVNTSFFVTFDLLKYLY